MEGSVLSFLKAEWKVSDTGSAQCWVSSSLYFQPVAIPDSGRTCLWYIFFYCTVSLSLYQTVVEHVFDTFFFIVLSACHYQTVVEHVFDTFFLLYFQPVTILDGGSASESPTVSPSSSPTPIHPRNLTVQSEDNDSVSSGTTKDSGYEVRYFIDWLIGV